MSVRQIRAQGGIAAMRIGFVGTGNIAAAVVGGLCTATEPPERVLVSPRNAEKAAALAARFPMVAVAPDNQAVVDGSDCVFMAVRPPLAEAVLPPLRLRPDHKVISLMAAVPLATLGRLVRPATDIVRAVPLPTAARHIGPIALFPDDGDAAALFGRIGTAVPVDDERLFDALCTVTAVAAAQYALLGRVADWLAAQGVEKRAAIRYVAAIAQAFAADAGKAEEHGFPALIEEVATPGGMNEQVLRMLTEADWFAAVDPALDTILARYRGTS